MKSNTAVEKLVADLVAEIERLDAGDGAGESGGLWAWVEEEGVVKIGDESYQLIATPQHLQALRKLPDGAGWEAAWDALDE